MGLRGPLPRDLGRETPLPGMPPMPPGLPARAQQIYRETARALRRVNSLSKLDGATLGEYATCCWWIEKLTAELDKGPLFTDGKEHPAGKALREVQVRMEKAATALGLHAQARQRTPPPPPAKTENPLEALERRRAAGRKHQG